MPGSPGACPRGGEFPPPTLHGPRDSGPPFPAPGGPLLCLWSEDRDRIAWDTSDPDPARWPVINAARVFEDEFAVFPGTLTEFIVAAMTYSHGIDLGDSAPGDPRHWTWPFWGPDAS